MTKENGYTYTFMGICIVLVIWFFASCTTTKYVDRYHNVVDSAVYIQNEALQRTLHETIVNYEKMLQDSTGVVIEYYRDTIQLPGTITIDRTGAIQAQGALKSVQVTNKKLEQEKSALQNRIDSFAVELDKEKHNIKREVKEVTKYVKRGLPIWIWLLVVVGWVARGYWPLIKLRLFGIK